MKASSVNIPPHKIVMCIAYPYEKTDFQRCFQTGKSDLIASLNLSHLSMEEAWQQYDKDLATGLRHCIDDLKSRNVDVLHLYDVNDMSSAAGYDVVIILAHHVEADDSIELLNGPVPTSIFAVSFLLVKDCIIDISSCFSMTFLQLQERFFPTCHILEVNAEPSFSLRLLLIQETIERLAHDSSRGYVDTLLDVYFDFLKIPKEDVFRHEHTHKSYYNSDLDALKFIGSYIAKKLNALNIVLKDQILQNYKWGFCYDQNNIERVLVPDFCKFETIIDTPTINYFSDIAPDIDEDKGPDAPSNEGESSIPLSLEDTFRSDYPKKEEEDWSDGPSESEDNKCYEPCNEEPNWTEGPSIVEYDWSDDPSYAEADWFDESSISKGNRSSLIIDKSKRLYSRRCEEEEEEFEEPNNSEGKNAIDKFRSSVYAPEDAYPGQSFMVQLFIHKTKDSSIVQITATSVDMTAGLRNRKSLSFPLNSGDIIKVRLEALFDKRKEFEIDESDKVTIWHGEPVSLDYVVNVIETCTAAAFRGRLRICVNSQTVGDILFNVFINNHERVPIHKGNDTFHFVPFDKRQEANIALKMLISKLEEQILTLENSIRDGQGTPANVNQELAICRLCLNLINNGCSKTSPVKVVFISSTADLKEYRDKVRKAIADCQMYPEMYEHWNQGDIYPRDKCCEKVMSSDIFICILGANYGRIDPMLGISMTEMEYRVAQLSSKSILIYIDDQYLSKMELLKDEQLKQKQLSLINEIKEKRWVQFFDSPESLEKLVRTELSDVKKTLV